MKRRTALRCMGWLLVFLFGVGVAIYPNIHGRIVDRDIQENAVSFLQGLEAPMETGTSEPTEPPEPPRPYAQLWDAMHSYNETIWKEEQSGLCDPWSYQQPSFPLKNYDIADEVFGVISIPRLSLEMPIYLGATAEHMVLGAAHLSQTSLPIGGENTNCVIAGHRGYNGASYFRYIPELQVGDTVTITNLWETLHYRVTGTQIIRPNDVDAIHIQPGKDMVTLLTCHPYASGGRQRYLVFCERAEPGGAGYAD